VTNSKGNTMMAMMKSQQCNSEGDTAMMTVMTTMCQAWEMDW